jgi:hypothetical protein
MPEATKADEIYQQLHPVIGEHDHDAVLGILRGALACPVCGAGRHLVCAACAGRVGGRRMTTKKWSQLKKAAQRPRPGRRKKRKPST